MSEKSKVEMSGNSPRPVLAKADPHRPLSNGGGIDWDYLEERSERARRAALRMGVAPCKPPPPMTRGELTRLAESTRRLLAMKKPKVRQSSEALVREMRDASVGIYPKTRK